MVTRGFDFARAERPAPPSDRLRDRLAGLEKWPPPSPTPLHEFRGEGVPGELEHDFYGMAPCGDNELLVTNNDHHRVHVLTV